MFRQNLKENDYQVGQLQDARTIVRWAFDAKQGQVSDPFSIKDDFIVAIVDKRLKEGIPDAETARPMVEGIIMNNKKTDIIKKKLNNPSTLEAAAASYNLQVLKTGEDSTLTFDAQIINGIGHEPKVAGAAFNKAYQTKISPAFEGNSGVFLIKVNGVYSKGPVNEALQKLQANDELNKNLQSTLNESFQELKKTADIKDYRSKFF